MRRIFLGVSGASGAIYGLRTLEELLRCGEFEVHVTITKAAAIILKHEHGIDWDLDNPHPENLNIDQIEKAVFHHPADVSAPPASGSFQTVATAVTPCSMSCAAAIANGLSKDLIERAADVALKERRPLLVVPRETPMSAIHLENLLKLSQTGATVLPAAPGFYTQPKSVDDMVDFVVARILDHLKVEHSLSSRWTKGLE